MLGRRSRLHETNGPLVEGGRTLEHTPRRARLHKAHRHSSNERTYDRVTRHDVRRLECGTRQALNHLETSVPPQRTFVCHRTMTDNANEHCGRRGFTRASDLKEQALANRKSAGHKSHGMV